LPRLRGLIERQRLQTQISDADFMPR